MPVTLGDGCVHRVGLGGDYKLDQVALSRDARQWVLENTYRGSGSAG
jgi:hypothetical protein